MRRRLEDEIGLARGIHGQEGFPIQDEEGIREVIARNREHWQQERPDLKLPPPLPTYGAGDASVTPPVQTVYDPPPANSQYRFRFLGFREGQRRLRDPEGFRVEQLREEERRRFARALLPPDEILRTYRRP